MKFISERHIAPVEVGSFFPQLCIELYIYFGPQTPILYGRCEFGTGECNGNPPKPHNGMAMICCCYCHLMASTFWKMLARISEDMHHCPRWYMEPNDSQIHMVIVFCKLNFQGSELSKTLCKPFSPQQPAANMTYPKKLIELDERFDVFFSKATSW